VLAFCFIKNEHPKGFGALEDCPNKIDAKHTIRLWLCHCLTGRSGIKRQKNKSFSFTAVPLFGWVALAKKRIKKGFVCRLAIAYNDPGSLAKCEERTFCQAGIIRSSKGYFLA
jgi:hypothetical protein